MKTNPLTALHAHRNVLGVIGICHCPTNKDLSDAYERFETIAKCDSATHVFHFTSSHKFESSRVANIITKRVGSLGAEPNAHVVSLPSSTHTHMQFFFIVVQHVGGSCAV